MGLDTYIYKGWQDEIDSYYDIKTKQEVAEDIVEYLVRKL